MVGSIVISHYWGQQSSAAPGRHGREARRSLGGMNSRNQALHTAKRPRAASVGRQILPTQAHAMYLYHVNLAQP